MIAPERGLLTGLVEAEGAMIRHRTAKNPPAGGRRCGHDGMLPLAGAGEANMADVKVREFEPGIYRLDVTARHADTGWKHHADKWDVVAPDGMVLGTRELPHPYEHEQPFTRTISGAEIPA